MIGIDAVCALIGDVDEGELQRWIGESWVLPERAHEGFVFHEVDVARVRLIVELRRDLAIDDEAMPVVLSLLDQLYALRRRLKAIIAAMDALPPELRAALAERLGEEEGEGE
jgi:chaperone modulatory protein CbpM